MAQFDQSTLAAVAVESRPALSLRDHAAAIIELSKPGIVRMVVIASAVGYLIGSIGAVPNLLVAAACLLGTALSAAGANALNMACEVERDSCMRRTAARPIPGGRLSRGAGYRAGVAMSVLGVGVLWFGAAPAAAVVSLATILSYVLFYTPLKAVTPLSTLVGAIPGALPPLVGWAAATGPVVPSATNSWHRLLDPGGWSLFALMFVWQIPHVMAISWKYRDDYAAGGYRVLPSVDPTGLKTARASVLWAATLIPVSVFPAVAITVLTDAGDEVPVLGATYVFVAVLCGLVMLWSTLEFLRERTNRRALIVFIVSILYLPAVLAVMLVDAFIVHRLW